MISSPRLVGRMAHIRSGRCACQLASYTARDRSLLDVDPRDSQMSTAMSTDVVADVVKTGDYSVDGRSVSRPVAVTRVSIHLSSFKPRSIQKAIQITYWACLPVSFPVTAHHSTDVSRCGLQLGGKEGFWVERGSSCETSRRAFSVSTCLPCPLELR